MLPDFRTKACSHVEVATETLARLHSLLNDWSTLRGREGQDALENVSGALAMFQDIHLGILERVLSIHSALLEPIPFPYTFDAPKPGGRLPRASRR